MIKRIFAFRGVILFALALGLALGFNAFYTAKAATTGGGGSGSGPSYGYINPSYGTSQTISLVPGWNMISTPRVVSSHSFSSTSSDYTIYVLNPSATSGWSTMADLNQNEFTPLFGYFIKNSTSVNQTLTFNYAQNLNPNQRLFTRSFSTTGWYSVGFANPDYLTPKCFPNTKGNNNSQALQSLNNKYDYFVDLSPNANSALDSLGISGNWSTKAPQDISSLINFSELKGYAVYINQANSNIIGSQNVDQAVDCSQVPFPVPTSGLHSVGTNVVDSTGVVYMISPDGTRRAYSSAGAFLSYGFNSFASVVSASPEDLALPVGAFIKPQDGTIICPTVVADDGTCVLVTNGKTATFASPGLITGLGFNLGSARIADVSWMATTTPITDTTSAHRSGVLVNNNGSVQMVFNGGLLSFPDIATFNSWGFSFNNVVVANSADKVLPQVGVMATRIVGQLAPVASVASGSLSNSKNSAFASQTVTPNVVKQKIGSFILQASSVEPVRVTGISVALSSGAQGNLPLVDLANLYLTDGTDTIIPVNPTSSQNFVVNFTLQPNETRTVDVYADIANVASADLGSSTQVTLGATAVGVNSGVSNSFSGLIGQTITVNQASLGTPTYDAGTSAKAQLVLGGTSLNNAYAFKFVSSNGNSTIKEMKFKIVGADGATPVGDGIISVSVDGISAPVILNGGDYVAYLTGLSHVIPQGAGGAYIYATPTFNTVGVNNASTNKVVKMALTYDKYNVGSGSDQTQTNISAVAINPFVLVATIPTITLDSSSPNKSSGYVPNTQSEIVRFDVTPSTSGTVNIKRIGFTPVYSISSGTISNNTVKLYDLTTDPGQVNSLGSATIGASGSQRVLTLTNDKSINSTHVFALVADTATGLTASTSGNQLTTISIEFDLTAVDDTAVGTGSDWQWNDNTVASGTYGNGYLLPNLKISGNNLVKSQ